MQCNKKLFILTENPNIFSQRYCKFKFEDEVKEQVFYLMHTWRFFDFQNYLSEIFGAIHNNTKIDKVEEYDLCLNVKEVIDFFFPEVRVITENYVPAFNLSEKEAESYYNLRYTLNQQDIWTHNRITLTEFKQRLRKRILSSSV